MRTNILAATVCMLLAACGPKPEEPGQDTAISSILPRQQISAYIRRIYQDRNGDLWLGTTSDGVARYNGESLVYYGPKQGFAGTGVRATAEDKAGMLWFATEAGLVRYDGKNFTNYGGKDGLHNTDLWSIVIDRRGTMWLATTNGVSRFDGRQFTRFELPQPVPASELPTYPERVWSIYEAADGNIWFGTNGHGIAKYDGQQITAYTEKEGLASNRIAHIIQDNEGRMWFCSRGGGVSRFDGKEFTNITEKEGLRSNNIWSCMQDRKGHMWFATSGYGVMRYDGHTFTNFTDKEGITQNHVQSLYEDKDGTMWFGFSGGLFRLAGQELVNVTRTGPWQ